MSNSKLSLLDHNLNINLGNYPLHKASSYKNLRPQDQNLYQSDRPDIILRSANKSLHSSESSSVLLPKQSSLIRLEPVIREPVPVLQIPAINQIPVQSAGLFPPSSASQNFVPTGIPNSMRLVSQSNLIPMATPLSAKRGSMAHLGTKIADDQNDIQHFVQHLMYKDSRQKSRSTRRSRRDYPEERERNNEGKKVHSILESQLGKQNEFMHKMLRDMEEYRRMEFKRHMALMDQITLNSTRMLNDNTPRIPSRSLSQEKLPLISNLHAKKPSTMIPMKQARRTLKKPSDVKKMLKAVAWALAFPGLWFNSVAIWAEKRCAVELYKLKDDVPQYLEMFLKLASQTVNNEVKKLVEEKNPLMIVTSRPLKIKDLDTRCTIIQEYLVLIIDQLSLQVAKDLLPTSFFTFLSNISENDAIIPQDFLSGFEISRLDFNMFGNLKNVNEWKSKMILACYLLLKGVVYFLLMRPQSVIDSINEKQLNIKNMFTVSSILYHVVMDVLEERVPLADPVRFRPQIQVTPTTFSAFENKSKERLLEVPPEYNPKDMNDIISGFYSRDQLAEFLDNRPKIANEVRDAVRDFLDVVYDITHRVVNKKSHVKQWFGNFRKGSPQKRR